MTPGRPAARTPRRRQIPQPNTGRRGAPTFALASLDLARCLRRPSAQTAGCDSLCQRQHPHPSPTTAPSQTEVAGPPMPQAQLWPRAGGRRQHAARSPLSPEGLSSVQIAAILARATSVNSRSKKFFAPHTRRPLSTTTPKHAAIFRQIATACRKIAAICRNVEATGLGITTPGHGRGAHRSGAHQTPEKSSSWPFLWKSRLRNRKISNFAPTHNWIPCAEDIEIGSRSARGYPHT